MPPFRHCRRQFLSSSLLSGVALGTGLGPILRPLFSDPETGVRRAVIHVFLEGGLSHLDTFDPKPDAPVEVRGPYDPIASRLDGVQVAGTLPRLAKVLDRFCVLRGVHHGEAGHERGVKAMLTGYRPSPAIIYPSMGSVFAHELPAPNALPPYVAIPDSREPSLGTGYLSAAHGPFSVGGDPSGSSFKVRDLAPPKEVDAARGARRRRFRELIDAHGTNPEGDQVAAMAAFYDRAFELVDTPAARQAFDLGKESGKVRDAYGRTRLGQGLLLARRLVEAGVHFVTVREGGFDHHRDLERELDRRLPSFDRALATLVTDLEERGRLDEVLVLVSTEFGRTPRVNDDRGRDHWPRCFSVVMAGGGLQRGLVHGDSGPEGAEPESDGVTPADIAATVFALSGIDPSKRLMAPGDRPIDIVRDGAPITAIMKNGGAHIARG